MDISIIIVNYKTTVLLIDCLKTVYKFTKKTSFEVIIVENEVNSDDESLVKKYFPDVIWHQMGYNSGFGRASNAGMKLAKGNFLLMLNPDTKLIDAAIDICFEKLSARPDIVAGGAYQLYPDITPRAFHHTFTFRRDFWIVPQFFRPMLEKLIPQTQYQDSEQVDYISAAFLMISSETFKQTGGFDEEFFLYSEDAEFGGRLAKIGKLLVFKDCRIIHEEWGSQPERYQETKDYSYVNRFDRQIQLSNLVWLRKRFGAGQFLFLMLHYWSLVPIFYIVKILLNIVNFRLPFSQLSNQKRFKDTIAIFSRFFWRILFKRPTFYKIPVSEK